MRRSKRCRASSRKSKSSRSRPRPLKRVRRKDTISAKSLARPSALSILPLLPNAQDNLIIQLLQTAPHGELAIDQLAPDFIAEVRAEMIAVVRQAALKRRAARATKPQMAYVGNALSLFERVIELLEKASTDGRDGLRRQVEGPLLDDPKGERESNELTAQCDAIRQQVAKLACTLSEVLENEKGKTRIGERQKRLRTLVEALGDWFESGDGSIAPTVDANRLYKGSRKPGDTSVRSVVHSRRGTFLSLAIALLCQVDTFPKSEVEAAVTNVHEARLAATKPKTAA